MHRLRRIATVAGASVLFAAAPAAAVPADLRGEAARDAATSSAVPTDLRSPDARTGTGTRTPVVPDPIVVRVPQPSGEGLSWDSAAVGGLITAGLLITLAGGGAAVGRRRVRSA